LTDKLSESAKRTSQKRGSKAKSCLLANCVSFAAPANHRTSPFAMAHTWMKVSVKATNLSNEKGQNALSKIRSLRGLLFLSEFPKLFLV